MLDWIEADEMKDYDVLGDKRPNSKLTSEQLKQRLAFHKRKEAADVRRLKQITLQRRAITTKVLDGSKLKLPKGERRYNQYRDIYEGLRITDKYKKLKDECYDTNSRTGHQQYLLTLERAAWGVFSKKLQMWKAKAKPKVGRSPDRGCIDCAGELTMIGKGIYKCKDCSAQNHLNKKCPDCGNMGCINIAVMMRAKFGTPCNCWGCQNCGGTICSYHHHR